MGAIDVWAQATTPRFVQEPWMTSLLRWTGKGEHNPPTGAAETLAAMDRGGVDIALLSAWVGPQGPLISNDDVEGFVAHAPDRFRGLMSVNLYEPMAAVREIRRLARSRTFVDVRVVPWLWDLPPSDRRYYPVYAACVEEGLPFCTQIGHTGPLKRSETGRPLPYLEDVLLDFPELTVVGGHVGAPWIEEVLLLARKFPNFHIDTSAYAVHRLPEALVAFMRGAGRTRVMFGTNWPMLSPKRALEKLTDLALDDEARDVFLGGNARRVFKLADLGRS